MFLTNWTESSSLQVSALICTVFYLSQPDIDLYSTSGIVRIIHFERVHFSRLASGGYTYHGYSSLENNDFFKGLGSLSVSGHF